MSSKSPKETRVAVVGAGLVGSLCASMLAKRGYDVTLYEYREDIRKTELVQGRSINLALSVRGRTALREVGLEQHIVHEHGIPMRGRMIHNVDGTTYTIPYDAVSNQDSGSNLTFGHPYATVEGLHNFALLEPFKGYHIK